MTVNRNIPTIRLKYVSIVFRKPDIERNTRVGVDLDSWLIKAWYLNKYLNESSCFKIKRKRQIITIEKKKTLKLALRGKC